LGLNRADALFRAGTYYYQPTLPGSRNGYEAAGTVEAVGEDRTAFAPGDLVMTAANFELSAHGVYGERVLLDESAVVSRPAGVDAVTAAAVWVTYCTAYGALVRTAGMEPGDRVLITGASSGVGTAALQVARRVGAIPIATTRPLTVHGYANPAVTRTAEGRRQASYYIDSGLGDGTLRPEIAEVFDGLDAIRDAHRLTESNTHTGKIVVKL